LPAAALYFAPPHFAICSELVSPGAQPTSAVSVVVE
jgi:hypothetical protein